MNGALIFAQNNQEIDYHLIAESNAVLIKKNLDIPVSLVTDNPDYTSEVFDKIIYFESEDKSNKRLYRHTVKKNSSLNFKNLTRCHAYDLTPYQNTLLVDADYFVQTDELTRCFEIDADIQIHSNVSEIMKDRKLLATFINNFGIDQVWATVVYFTKTREAKSYFELVKEIASKYDLYREIYSIESSLFRNDFVFSIATHIFNGMTKEKLVSPLPITSLLMSTDYDDVLDYKDGKLLMAASVEGGDWFVPVQVSRDLHIMNKWAAMSVAKRILGLPEDVYY